MCAMSVQKESQKFHDIWACITDTPFLSFVLLQLSLYLIQIVGIFSFYTVSFVNKEYSVSHLEYICC